MMSFLFGKRKKRLIYVKVTTMDADLDAIPIEADSLGRDLFEMVCRVIGLREVWYFGLQFTNKKGHQCWLQLDKKILNQDVVRQPSGSYNFIFLVKFYPEVIEEELVQDITRHLFFLQIKQSIISMALYCQPEAAVLLASFAIQAMYGDYSENIELELDKLLPQSVIDQFDMTSEMWEEKIKNWWTSNQGMMPENAEMEYLRVAQDLAMYGIQYYPIYNQKDTDLLLGISAQGLGIYETSNKLSPRPFFPWSEIKNIHFSNKMFTIKVTDKSKIKFRAQENSVNHSILDLCIGTHNLYLRRRQTDTLEIQQMKQQAEEIRNRRSKELAEIQKEREHRKQIEMERDQLRNEIQDAKEKLAAMSDVMYNNEQMNNFMVEKTRITEEEILKLSKRALLAEAEVQRIRVKMKEQHDDENHDFTATMLADDEPPVPYWQGPISYQMGTAPQLAGQTYVPPQTATPTEDAGEGDAPPVVQFSSAPPSHPYSNEAFYYEPPRGYEELLNLQNILEKTNSDGDQRNREFLNKLADFRNDINALKSVDRQTEHDRIHEKSVLNGFNRYSTLRQSSSGTSKSRVHTFDHL